MCIYFGGGTNNEGHEAVFKRRRNYDSEQTFQLLVQGNVGNLNCHASTTKDHAVLQNVIKQPIKIYNSIREKFSARIHIFRKQRHQHCTNKIPLAYTEFP